MDRPGGDEELRTEGLVESLRHSLLRSTYSDPVVARVEVEDASVSLPVVVVEMRSRFESFPSGAASSETLGCWNHPTWEFEAILVRPPFDPVQSQTRVLIRAETDSDGRCERALMSLIT